MENRKHPADRENDIFEAAITLAKGGALYNMSGHQIGQTARCSRTLINQYFYSIEKLRQKVIRHALRNEIWEILAQATARYDPLVKDMSDEQRLKMAEWIGTHQRD